MTYYSGALVKVCVILSAVPFACGFNAIVDLCFCPAILSNARDCFRHETCLSVMASQFTCTKPPEHTLFVTFANGLSGFEFTCPGNDIPRELMHPQQQLCVSLERSGQRRNVVHDNHLKRVRGQTLPREVTTLELLSCFAICTFTYLSLNAFVQTSVM